jgi:Zn-dependent protease
LNLGQLMAVLLPYVPAFLLAISVHESAHAWVARRCGDSTAADQGRISLYPPRHVDPFGTILLPVLSLWLLGFFFGYAKPTPVNPARLRRPKRDFSWVALAGPLSNFLLALLSALAGRLALSAGADSAALISVLSASVTLNLVLGLLNLMPVPGFDGIKALYVLLPDSWCWRLNRADRSSILILALLSVFGAFSWLVPAVRALSMLSGQWLGFPV